VGSFDIVVCDVMTESVVVGVRVRPYNSREIGLNAELCIHMSGPTTSIATIDGKATPFTFDESFWSHDGFFVDANGYSCPKPGSIYADQRYVFETFGQRVLNNAWDGFHCCLFAYGQTGAGKSYSMVGYGANKGIVPITCEEIFLRIGTNQIPDKRYEVTVSMVEIYNECVQDLLILPEDRPKKGLEIRESKILGIYIDGVTKTPVDTYEAIDAVINEATSHRTVGSTLMNATSSRAHTVQTIEFKQVDMVGGKEMVKLSMINLVDLAGSEKAGQTGASGDRLKEGCAINSSLTALGNVIEKLAERSQAKGKKAAAVIIPYRNSKLTRLLQNALGGSSKTIMICALSPASSNYEETLSTLRYADRAKKIKNTAVVNENPQDKLMRELKEENENLRRMMEHRAVGTVTGATEEKQSEIEDMKTALRDMQKTFEEKKLEAMQRDAHKSRKRASLFAQTIHAPQMSNLNEDFQLNGKLKYSFPADKISLIGALVTASDSDTDSEEEDSSATDGDSDSDREPDIILANTGILPKHASVVNCEGKCFLNAYIKAADVTFINGVSFFELTANTAEDVDAAESEEDEFDRSPERLEEESESEDQHVSSDDDSEVISDGQDESVGGMDEDADEDLPDANGGMDSIGWRNMLDPCHMMHPRRHIEKAAEGADSDVEDDEAYRESQRLKTNKEIHLADKRADKERKRTLRREERIRVKIKVKQEERMQRWREKKHIRKMVTLRNSGIELQHGDRIAFFKSIFVFVDLSVCQAEIMLMSGQVTYQRAKKELKMSQRLMRREQGGVLDDMIRTVSMKVDPNDITSYAQRPTITSSVASRDIQQHSDGTSSSDAEGAEDEALQRSFGYNAEAGSSMRADFTRVLAERDREIAELKRYASLSPAAVLNSDDPDITDLRGQLASAAEALEKVGAHIPRTLEAAQDKTTQAHLDKTTADAQDAVRMAKGESAQIEANFSWALVELDSLATLASRLGQKHRGYLRDAKAVNKSCRRTDGSHKSRNTMIRQARKSTHKIATSFNQCLSSIASVDDSAVQAFATEEWASITEEDLDLIRWTEADFEQQKRANEERSQREEDQKYDALNSENRMTAARALWHAERACMNVVNDRGNIRFDLQSGLATMYRPIRFELRQYTTDNVDPPTAVFYNEQAAYLVLEDVAEIFKFYTDSREIHVKLEIVHNRLKQNCPKHKMPTEKRVWYDELAKNRAALVRDRLANMGVPMKDSKRTVRDIDAGLSNSGLYFLFSRDGYHLPRFQLLRDMRRERRAVLPEIKEAALGKLVVRAWNKEMGVDMMWSRAMKVAHQRLSQRLSQPVNLLPILESVDAGSFDVEPSD